MSITPHITLHAFRGSQPSRAVELTLKLLKMDYDFKPVDFASGVTRTEEFQHAINPTGTIPVLVLSTEQSQMAKTDIVMHESHAIMRLLCRMKSRGAEWQSGDAFCELYPSIFGTVTKDEKGIEEMNWNLMKTSARIDQYMDWHHSGIRAHSFPIAVDFLLLQSSDIPKLLVMEAFQKRILKHHNKLKKGLQIINDYYLNSEKGQKFLCTNHLTLADLSAGCELYHLYCYGYPFSELGFHRIVDWFHALEKVEEFHDIHKDLIRSGNEFKLRHLNYLSMLK